MRFLTVLLFLLFSSCASKNPVAGRYSGLYEVALSEKVSCHFLMKKDELAAVPTVLCHDAEEAWAVPIADFAGSVWLAPPLVTQSETLIAFLETKDAAQTSVLVSTDKGRNWDIHPVLKKKVAGDKLASVLITKAGKISATYSANNQKPYSKEQEASFKSKFTPVKVVAKAYPESCFSQHTKGPEQKVPAECLSGYLSRLLK
jgi:hypothetical protein